MRLMGRRYSFETTLHAWILSGMLPERKYLLLNDLMRTQIADVELDYGFVKL